MKTWVIPARLEQIDLICSELRRWLTEQNMQAHQFGFELLLREALNNAILHGCKLNPDRHVEIEFSRKGSELKITINDDGSGFDWRSLIQRDLVETERENGRGLKLYQLYSDHFEFNDPGNQVTLVRLTNQENSSPTSQNKREGT